MASAVADQEPASAAAAGDVAVASAQKSAQKKSASKKPVKFQPPPTIVIKRPSTDASEGDAPRPNAILYGPGKLLLFLP